MGDAGARRILRPDGNLATPGNMHNLLIFGGTGDASQGERSTYNDWQRAVDAVTPKGRPKSAEEGDNLEYNDGAARAPKQYDVISLPPNFCPYCGKTDVTRSKRAECASLACINQEYPGLGLNQGHAVSHWMCLRCAETIFFEKHDSTLNYSETYWQSKREERRAKFEKNIIEFISSQVQKGNRRAVLGDDSRIERFKHLDDTEDRV